MHRLTILLVFLSVLFIQFGQEQAASLYVSPLDEIEDHPSPSSASLLNSWYNRLNDLQENDPEENVDQLWKRLSPDLSPLRQRRRFGNTRYGRSLPDNLK